MESNPVLRNITDFLIEEVSAEEEELTGVAANEAKDPASSEVALETDEKLLQVRLYHSTHFIKRTDRYTGPYRVLLD